MPVNFPAVIAPRTTLPRPGTIPSSIPWRRRAPPAGRAHPSPREGARGGRRGETYPQARRLSLAPRGGRARPRPVRGLSAHAQQRVRPAPSVTPVSPPPLAAVEASAPPVRPAAAEAQTDLPARAGPRPGRRTPRSRRRLRRKRPCPRRRPRPPPRRFIRARGSFLRPSGRPVRPPPAQEIPDWLTAARQNQTAPSAAPAARVTHAPPSAPRRWTRWGGPLRSNPGVAPTPMRPPAIRRTSSPAAQPGSPGRDGAGYGHKRHGAQYTAARREEARIEVPPRAQTAAGPSSYPPPREAWAREQQAASMAAAPRVRYAPQAAPRRRRPARTPTTR
jgi:hypothetical protein